MNVILAERTLSEHEAWNIRRVLLIFRRQFHQSGFIWATVFGKNFLSHRSNQDT